MRDGGPDQAPAFGPDGAPSAGDFAVPAGAQVPGGGLAPGAAPSAALDPSSQFLRPELSGGPDPLLGALYRSNPKLFPPGDVVDPNTGAVSHWRAGVAGDALHPGGPTLAPLGPADKQSLLENVAGAGANYPLGKISPPEQSLRQLLSPQEQSAPIPQPAASSDLGADSLANFPEPNRHEQAVLATIAPGEGAFDPGARENGLYGYDSVYANGKYGRPERPISNMTADQVIAFQQRMIAAERQEAARRGKHLRHGFAPVGKYQINCTTLQDYKKRYHLPGDAVMTPDLQERIAARRLNDAGFGKFMSGQLSEKHFHTYMGGAWDSIERSGHPGRTPWARILAAIRTADPPGDQAPR